MNNKNLIAQKANRVFAIIIIAFILIVLRIWFLSIISHEDYVTLSKRPQRKTFIEEPFRGTIRDRDNEPLATNKIVYTAGIRYEDIKQIPRVKLIKQKNKKVKHYPRKTYIERLSQFLAQELGLESSSIEDLIYSKAAIFPSTPFILKTNLDEKTYAQLKAKEKDWPGMKMEIAPKRFYPHGKLASNIIGYVGHIPSYQYLHVREEKRKLMRAVQERNEGLPIPLPEGYLSWKHVKERLKELNSKSYTINSKVGKSGIEKQFDEDLRGFSGKSKYEIDILGRLLRKLPDSKPAVNGRRVLLTISHQLQDYAEKLLTENEYIRDKGFRFAGKGHGNFQGPWIKGGSIVVYDIKQSQVLSMASYPRFNPNDFIEGNSPQMHKWLETEQYIHRIWEGEYPFEKEYFDAKKGYYIKEKPLTWTVFLDQFLSLHCQVRKQIHKVPNISTAVLLLNVMESFKELFQCEPWEFIDSIFPENESHIPCNKKANPIKVENEALFNELKDILTPYLQSISHNGDKLLFFDLLKIACPHTKLSDEILQKIGDWTIEQYFSCHQKLLQINRQLKQHLKKRFHRTIFPKWREEHFAEFLKEKRLLEKKNKTYQRPFSDYLEKEEQRQFNEFYEKKKLYYLAKCLSEKTDLLLYGFSSQALDHITQLLQDFTIKERFDLILSVRCLSDMDTPLWGRYPQLRADSHYEQDLARRFYPITGFGYLRCNAYQEPATLGSIYKIVTAYEAIKQHKKTGKDLNPLILFDEIKKERLKNKGQILGYTADRKPITRRYKGGRLPKSHKSSGKLDLIRAFEHSSNIYFSLLASEVIDTPKSLYNTSKDLSFGVKTGIDLPHESAGILPQDLTDNKTGLYSFAIGQHAFTATALQTAVMMSGFANDGKILKPQIVKAIANIEPSHNQENLFSTKNYAYQDYLSLVGIFFPFFTEAKIHSPAPYLLSKKRQYKKQIELDKDVKDYLFYAMRRVVNGKEGSARSTVIRLLYSHPQMKRNYVQNQPYLIGKTATAENAFHPTFDRETKPILTKNIWFAGITFSDKEHTDPELAIVVYLRYGDYGKEAAPLASEMMTKWKEISSQQKH